MKTFLVMTVVQLAILTLYVAALIKHTLQRLFQRGRN
jgi:hypothetical protein